MALLPGLDREQLSARGYLAGWRLVRLLPEKWAKRLLTGAQTAPAMMAVAWSNCAKT